MVDDGTRDWGESELTPASVLLLEEFDWVQELDALIYERTKFRLTSSDTSCYTWAWFHGGLSVEEAFDAWVERHYL